MKSSTHSITSTRSLVIDVEPLTRIVQLHVVGNAIVYIGGSDVTAANGLSLEKHGAPQAITIPAGETLHAITAAAVTEELRILVQGD